MNNKRSITYLISVIAFWSWGCHGPVKEENKNNAPAAAVSQPPVGNGKNVTVDTTESVVTWKGGMLMDANDHTGYVYLSKGELTIDNGQLVGGTVEVDMNSIEDEGHGSDNNLIRHLKDPDFFDVKNFPISMIAITRVTSTSAEDKEITGNLTIKGITNPVTFPAKIAINEGVIRANGKLVIDRAKWNIRYKSGKFYTLLADQTISDSIEFHFKIVAKE